MILVEIYVACLDKVYDFRLDTSAIIEDVIEDIITIVSHKENLTLSIVSKEVVVNKKLTLADYKVKQGMKLILV